MTPGFDRYLSGLVIGLGMLAAILIVRGLMALWEWLF